MTKPRQSMGRLIKVATLLVVVACAWSYQQMQTEKENLDQTAASMNKCLQLHDGIVSLREGTMELNWLAPSNYQPGPAIDQALRAAKIEFAHLSVTATAGRGLPDSEYVEVPIGMPTVENVTLEQVITFLTELALGPTRHQVHEIGLSANKKEPTKSLEHPTWNLECQISYFALHEND